MTTTIADPYEYLLEPEDVLTRGELNLVNEVAERDSHTLAQAAVAMGTAFLIYRLYMQRKVKSLMKEKEPTSANLRKSIEVAYGMFATSWMRMVAPHAITGYLFGMRDARMGNVEPEFLLDVAQHYTATLGEHVNEVSAEAMVAGYQAQLNRKVPSARALSRTLQATGVSPRTMNTLVSVWTSEDPKKLSSIVPEDHISKRAEKIIREEALKRGRLIGENESWSTKEQAKQIIWMYGMQQGVIPKAAKRKWMTAKDELVCESCGPMHGSEMLLGERFSTPMGDTWSPPLHVNCRCTVELVVDLAETTKDSLLRVVSADNEQLVMKARGDDPYDRKPDGRFASHESRGPAAKKATPARAPQTKTRQVDPEVANLLAQHQARTKADVDNLLASIKDTKAPSIATPSIGIGKPSISIPSISGASLPAIATPKLPGIKTPEVKPHISDQGASVSGEAAIEFNVGLLDAKLKDEAKASLKVSVDTTIRELLIDTSPKKVGNYYRLDAPLVGILPYSYIDSASVITRSDEAGLDETYIGPFGETYITTGGGNYYFTYSPEDLSVEIEDYWERERGALDDLFDQEDSIMKVADYQLEITDDAKHAALTYALTQGRNEEIPLRDLNTGKSVLVSLDDIAEFYEMTYFINEHRPVVAIMEHSQIGNSTPGGYVANPGKWRMEKMSQSNEFDLESGYPYVAMTFTPIGDDDDDYFH